MVGSLNHDIDAIVQRTGPKKEFNLNFKFINCRPHSINCDHIVTLSPGFFAGHSLKPSLSSTKFTPAKTYSIRVASALARMPKYIRLS